MLICRRNGVRPIGRRVAGGKLAAGRRAPWAAGRAWRGAAAPPAPRREPAGDGAGHDRGSRRARNSVAVEPPKFWRLMRATSGTPREWRLTRRASSTSSSRCSRRKCLPGRRQRRRCSGLRAVRQHPPPAHVQARDGDGANIRHESSDARMAADSANFRATPGRRSESTLSLHA